MLGTEQDNEPQFKITEQINMKTPYYGPTVHEAAEARIAKNKRLIEELQQDTQWARNRLENLSFANVLEAERIASNAEPFQNSVLESHPENPAAVS